MSTSTFASTPQAPPRWVRIAVTSLFLVWTAFWAWFMGASAIGEEGGAIVHVPQLAVLAALVLAVWRWPRWGGTALCALGVLAVIAIYNPVGRFAFAAPMLAFGAYYAWLGWKDRRP